MIGEKKELTEVEEEVTRSAVRFNAALDRLEKSVEHGIDAAADAIGLTKEPAAIAKEIGSKVEESLTSTVQSTEEVLKDSGARILADLQKATRTAVNDLLTFTEDRRMLALTSAFALGCIATFILTRRGVRGERPQTPSQEPAA